MTMDWKASSLDAAQGEQKAKMHEGMKMYGIDCKSLSCHFHGRGTSAPAYQSQHAVQLIAESSTKMYAWYKCCLKGERCFEQSVLSLAKSNYQTEGTQA